MYKNPIFLNIYGKQWKINLKQFLVIFTNLANTSQLLARLIIKQEKNGVGKSSPLIEYIHFHERNKRKILSSAIINNEYENWDLYWY